MPGTSSAAPTPRTRARSLRALAVRRTAPLPTCGNTERRFNGGHITDEHISQDSNLPGTLSLLTTRGQHNTGGSKFLMNLNDNSYYDWLAGFPEGHKFTVFGKITRGYGVCVSISQVRTLDRTFTPEEPVRMHSITISGI